MTIDFASAVGHWWRTVSVSCLCAAALGAQAQVPPNVGATWKINANGYPGDLVLSQGSDGRLTGTVYGQAIDGFYAAGAGTIAFVRYQAPGKPFQMFIGTASGQGLRGDFYPITPDGGATAARLRYEWSASLATAIFGQTPLRSEQAKIDISATPAKAAVMAAAVPNPPAQPSALRFSGFVVSSAPRVDSIRPGSEASTIATCPQGKVASGFAGHSAAPSILGNAYVIEIAPLPDGSGFKFRAFNGGLLTPDFVLLDALCIDRPEGYEIVEASRTLRAQERASVEAACPNGKVLIGGGTRTGRSVYTAASAPRVDGGAWQAHFRNDRLLGGQDSAQVIAICVSDRYVTSRALVASPAMSIGPGARANVPEVGCGANTGLSAGVHSSATTIERPGPKYMHTATSGQPRAWAPLAIRNTEADSAVVGLRAICGSFM